MQQILLVEDDDIKALKVLTLIEERFPQLEVLRSRSVNGSLLLLTQRCPAVVLLDMSIPTLEPDLAETGGVPIQLGGKELLGHLDRLDINVPVIVVTQFDIFGIAPSVTTLDELDKSLRAEYPELYRGHVYYHATINGWQGQLSDKIAFFID